MSWKRPPSPPSRLRHKSQPFSIPRFTDDKVRSVSATIQLWYLAAMHVYITGVAGFLGSHLADALLTLGHQVSGCDSLIGGSVENVPEAVDFKVLDCNALPSLREHMRGCDVVAHCACTAHEGLSVFSPHENALNGYAASLAVFAAAAGISANRIVNCSSMARYGALHPPFTEDMVPHPQDPYGVGKLAAEETLKVLSQTHGFAWSTLVPHNIYGPKQCYTDPYRNVAAIFMNLMLQGRQPTIYGDGHQERCFSHVSDCIGPIVQAIEGAADGEVVNIGPDTGVITVLELAQLIAEILDFKLDPFFLPARPCEVKLAHCSSDKARRLLGYEAKMPLEEGLRAMAEWMRKRGPQPFNYRLGIEIDSPRVPRTWRHQLF